MSSMPTNELVRSNHQDVVDVACFEGTVTFSFSLFLFDFHSSQDQYPSI